MITASSSGAVGRTIFSPGDYLKKRREAAGLSLGEVARQLAVIQLGAIQLDRANLLDQLERIEAGEAALALPQADLLRNVFAFDPSVYNRLLAGDTLPQPPICRVCACSFFDPCDTSATDQGGSFRAACHWAEPDLCSACADHPSGGSVGAAQADEVGSVAENVEPTHVTPAHEGAR